MENQKVLQNSSMILVRFQFSDILKILKKKQSIQHNLQYISIRKIVFYSIFYFLQYFIQYFSNRKILFIRLIQFKNFRVETIKIVECFFFWHYIFKIFNYVIFFHNPNGSLCLSHYYFQTAKISNLLLMKIFFIFLRILYNNVFRK